MSHRANLSQTAPPRKSTAGSGASTPTRQRTFSGRHSKRSPAAAGLDDLESASSTQKRVSGVHLRGPKLEQEETIDGQAAVSAAAVSVAAATAIHTESGTGKEDICTSLGTEPESTSGPGQWCSAHHEKSTPDDTNYLEAYDNPELAKASIQAIYDARHSRFEGESVRHKYAETSYENSLGLLRGPFFSGSAPTFRKVDTPTLADGGPLWRWYYDHIMEDLMLAMRRVAEFQPENPLKYMGEYFIERSKDLPTAQQLSKEAQQTDWRKLKNVIRKLKVNTIVENEAEARKMEKNDWVCGNKQVENVLRKAQSKYEKVPAESDSDVSVEVAPEDWPPLPKFLPPAQPSETGVITLESILKGKDLADHLRVRKSPRLKELKAKKRGLRTRTRSRLV